MAYSLKTAILFVGALFMLEQAPTVVSVHDEPASSESKERGQESAHFFQHVLANVAAAAREKLVRGSSNASKDGPYANVFDGVDVSLPVGVPISTYSSEIKTLPDGAKNLVGLSAMLQTSGCLAYGLGVSAASTGMDSNFEQAMAERGCETHAFDCTVSPTDSNVAGKDFHFHQWCIGQPNKAASTGAIYQSAVDAMGANNQTLVYKPLDQTRRELKHTGRPLNLLKFDIEGYEWDLFSKEILQSGDLPDEMSFELHTEGAWPNAVNPELVHGKGQVEVDDLFLKLFDLGYRVTSKTLNPVDSACAEFVLVRV